MSLSTFGQGDERHRKKTKLEPRGSSDRWTPREANRYIDMAVSIGDLTTGTRTGVRQLMDIGAFPISPFELGDLVASQNPDVLVEYPWTREGALTNADTYPFTVQRRTGIAN